MAARVAENAPMKSESVSQIAVCIAALRALSRSAFAWVMTSFAFFGVGLAEARARGYDFGNVGPVGRVDVVSGAEVRRQQAHQFRPHVWLLSLHGRIVGAQHVSTYPATGPESADTATACVAPSTEAPMIRGRCQKDCPQHGGDRPCQEAVRGIPELHFGRMNSDPLGSEAAREIAADGRRQHRHHDEE
jgi:hypothetical protein